MHREDPAISRDTPFTETETVAVAASTDDPRPDDVVSENHQYGAGEAPSAPRERESFARRRERSLEGLGKLLCSMLEWLVWLIGMLFVAITILTLLQLLPFAIVLIIIALGVKCRQAINGALARRRARRVAAAAAAIATTSEITRHTQIHGQLILRQCLAVESCQSDAAVPRTWGDNALENHTSSEALYWPVSQADECRVCYLFSARRWNVSGSDMAAPEIDIELAEHFPKKKSNTKQMVIKETALHSTDDEPVYDPDYNGANPSQSGDEGTASQQGKQDDAPRPRPAPTAACDICLADFLVGAYVAWSNNAKCRHAFHAHCILEWLRHQPTCPTCRQDYLL